MTCDWQEQNRRKVTCGILCACLGRGESCQLSQRVLALCWLLSPSLVRPVSTDRADGWVLTGHHRTIKVHEKLGLTVYACDPNSSKAEAKGWQA